MAGHQYVIFGFILVFISLVSSFDSRCGGKEVILASPSQWIVSPDYPFKYPRGLDCRWNVRAKPHEKIELFVQEFTLDGRRDTKCFDYLSISDTSIAPFDSVLFSGCGQELTKRTVIQSRTNEVFLTFHSDDRSGAPGNAKFAVHCTAIGCPFFTDLTGPYEVDLVYDNTTGLATTAIVRCSQHYAFRNVALRERGFQELTCFETRWDAEVAECIAMTSAGVTYAVTDTPTKMMASNNTGTSTVMPKEEGSNGGVIAGIILGILAAAVLVVLVIFLWRKHKRGKASPRRPPAVHNDQVYGPTTQPIETVSGKNRFGLFQKSKDKYSKDAHHDSHQAKNLLTNGKPSKNADIPGLYEEVDDNSRTQLTVNMHDHSDVEDDHTGAVYYEANRPDVVTMGTGGGDGQKLDQITTVENQHYTGP